MRRKIQAPRSHKKGSRNTYIPSLKRSGSSSDHFGNKHMRVTLNGTHAVGNYQLPWGAIHEGIWTDLLPTIYPELKREGLLLKRRAAKTVRDGEQL